MGEKKSNYNEWPNRATWNVMLWLDNDEVTYRYYTARVRELIQQGRKITGVRARAIARAALGDSTPDGVKLGLYNVRWSHIAGAMVEGVN